MIDSNLLGAAVFFVPGAAGSATGGAGASARGVTGKLAFASGRFASDGDAMMAQQVLRRITTDATATRLTSDNAAPGAANTLNLPNNSAYRMKVMIVGLQTAGTAGAVNDAISVEFNLLMVRGANAAATSIVAVSALASEAIGAAGSPFTPTMKSAAMGSTITYSADTTNGGLNLTVAGQVDKTIRWVAYIFSAEVTA